MTSLRCATGSRASGVRPSGAPHRRKRKFPIKDRRLTMLFAKPFGGRFHPRLSMSATLVAAFCIASAGVATAAEKLTYLLPAPPSLPAFAPWVLAKHLGYYAEAGYDVDFVVARGGVDVAKQIGVGNAPIGGAIGDTPIIVRGNGVPVKSVGLM